jgi:uncharacterized protein (DUF2141 family)
MPNEGYGFSNNVVGNFGKPTFKEAIKGLTTLLSNNY